MAFRPGSGSARTDGQSSAGNCGEVHDFCAQATVTGQQVEAAQLGQSAHRLILIASRSTCMVVAPHARRETALIGRYGREMTTFVPPDFEPPTPLT